MNKPDAIEIFEKLVSIDSTSEKSNLPIADYICELFDGRATIERDIDETAQKTNLLIRLGPSDTTRDGLILSGHMDCVPAREDSWESDPFRLTDRGDRWAARGASDMKGFLAMAIEASVAVDTTKLKHPLALLFTYDEEVGTLGAHHFVKNFAQPDTLPRNVIIGEPTSLRVVRMNKGHLKMRVTITGKSAHSGYPHLGRNAIEMSPPVVAALSKLRQEMEDERSEYGQFFSPVKFVTLNIGTVRGGSAVNVVPDRCIFELGVRLLPGMSSEEMLQRTIDAVKASGVADTEVSLISTSPPVLLDAGAGVHRELCAINAQTTTESVSFATDGGWLQSIDLDCVLWGPGSIEVAHRPNEFMPKDEFHRARPLLTEAIARFCL